MSSRWGRMYWRCCTIAFVRRIFFVCRNSWTIIHPSITNPLHFHWREKSRVATCDLVIWFALYEINNPSFTRNASLNGYVLDRITAGRKIAKNNISKRKHVWIYIQKLFLKTTGHMALKTSNMKKWKMIIFIQSFSKFSITEDSCIQATFLPSSPWLDGSNANRNRSTIDWSSFSFIHPYPSAEHVVENANEQSTYGFTDVQCN